jgi:Transcriptional Coactivator p15 (PC4)
MTPFVIAEWPTGRRGEVIRGTIDEYGGNPLVSIRKWVEAEDGSMRPRKGGVALGMKHFHRLASSLSAAREHALEEGLIEAERGSTQ